MADNDVATEEAEKKGVVVPAIAGVAGFIGGGIGAAQIPQFTRSKKLDAELSEATGKRDSAKALIEERTAKIKPLLKDDASKQDAINYSKNKFETALNKEFYKEVESLNPEKRINLAIRLNQNALEKIELLPSDSPARVHSFFDTVAGDYKDVDAVAHLKKQIGILEELAKDPDFKNLKPDQVESAISKIDSVHHSKEDYIRGIKETAPELESRISAAEANLRQGLEKDLNLIEHFKEGGDFQQQFNKYATQDLETWGKQAEELSATKNILEDTKGFKGAFSRPIKLLKEGTNYTKFAIVASSVALAATLYAGARALSGGKKKSFADDVTQRRAENAQAAAAPSV